VKTELKNINSFRALHRAIQFEVARQVEVLESGGTVVQETRGWSEAEQRTFAQRSKEFAEDYRYFPEPDLPPLELDRAWIEELRSSLPEMPGARRSRLVAVASGIRRWRCPMASGDATGSDPAQPRPTAAGSSGGRTGRGSARSALAEIVKLVAGGKITRDQGREVLGESLKNGSSPAEIVAARGFAQDSDEASVRAIVEAVMAGNARAVEDYRAGKKQALGALMADLKKRAPQANPKVASAILARLLET
jgi:aspartyl-tRNA(Asn)/glutamyl-tRNA(Gln) amidotransferase subunit B